MDDFSGNLNEYLGNILIECY